VEACAERGDESGESCDERPVIAWRSVESAMLRVESAHCGAHGNDGPVVEWRPVESVVMRVGSVVMMGQSVR
jgi:hypothetical protein